MIGVEMLGRPRKGTEVKRSYSVRLEPKVKEKICKKYGSIQKFIDGIINGDIHVDTKVKK